MITYEEKAEIFTRALAASGGSVPEALRRLDRELRWTSPRSRQGEARRQEARRLRAEGNLLSEISEQLGISEEYASHLCRGMPRPSLHRTAPPPSPLGLAIREEVGRRLQLEPGWAMQPRERGRQPAAHTLGRKVAMVAMREAGLSFIEIGLLLRRNHATVIQAVKAARASVDARPLAAEVLAAVRAAEAAPERAAEGRAA